MLPSSTPAPKMETGPFSEPPNTIDSYEKDLAKALADREANMHSSVRRSAANDITNAMLYGMGIDYKVNHTADAHLFQYRLYHDAFVYDNHVDGVYAHIKNS